jgi:hypothetical protein
MHSEEILRARPHARLKPCTPSEHKIASLCSYAVRTFYINFHDMNTFLNNRVDGHKWYGCNAALRRASQRFTQGAVARCPTFPCTFSSRIFASTNDEPPRLTKSTNLNERTH